MESDERFDQILAAVQGIQLNIEGIRGTLHCLEKCTEDQEARLRIVERWQNRISPIVALGTFVCGVMFQVTISKWLAG